MPAAPAAGIQFGPALGLAPDAATVLFVAFCSIDLAIGGLILARWRPAAVAAAQFALVLGYSLAVAWIAPGLWLDPFGPMVKNAAVLGCVLALAAMDSDR